MRDTPELSQILHRLSCSLPPADDPRLRHTELFSLTLDTPGFRLSTLPPLEPPFLYWHSPQQDCRRLGIGRVHATPAHGPQRLATLGEGQRRLQQHWLHENVSADGRTAPALFCVAGFDPDDDMQGPWEGLPNSTLLLPRLLFHERGRRSTLTLSCTKAELQQRERLLTEWSQQLALVYSAVSDAGGGPDENSVALCRRTDGDDDWHGMVREAIGAIEAGQLQKVVAARSVRVAAERPFSVAAVLARLERLYPSCQLLAIGLDERTLVSATPERLASLHAGIIECDALGGTTGRAPDPRHDHSLGLRLLNSRKARHEHALVVEAIRDTLTPLCTRLEVPKNPGIERLRNLQHLKTTLRGTLRPGTGLLEVAHRLHPTPAVAGTPTAAACDWLQRHENLRRGWYSGLAGWLHKDGGGELAVLLRCALLRGSEAELFAGAGIVADSDPAAELHETGMKLRAMYEALQGEPDCRKLAATPGRRARRS
ncbi:MAG TPA: isochorismate synthase [Gammaproteobacteria bacterium]|nr:isochorismate synthase [Gammaproteobacteria bacterium]